MEITSKFIGNKYYFNFEDFCKKNEIYDMLNCWSNIPESNKFYWNNNYYVSYEVLLDIEVFKHIFGVWR